VDFFNFDFRISVLHLKRQVPPEGSFALVSSATVSNARKAPPGISVTTLDASSLVWALSRWQMISCSSDVDPETVADALAA
jgi:hypothetical protein